VLDAAGMGQVEVEIVVPLSDGKTLQRLENRSEVLDRRYDESGTHVTMRVRIGKRQLDQLRSGGASRLDVRDLPPIPTSNGQPPARGKNAPRPHDLDGPAHSRGNRGRGGGKRPPARRY